MESGIWSVLHKPSVVSCCWVYTIKYKLDGFIDGYKTRLVAKAFSQTYDDDHFETAFMAHLNSVHIMFALTINMDRMIF